MSEHLTGRGTDFSSKKTNSLAALEDVVSVSAKSQR